jgi:cytochrome-b5 reductase
MLVFSVNTNANMLLKLKFEYFERCFLNRFKAIYTINDLIPGFSYLKEYITRKLLSKVITATPKTENTKVFVCEPLAIEDALVGSQKQPGILGKLGYTKD